MLLGGCVLPGDFTVDQTVRTFQDQFVAASRQLYTWRHGEAGELICGSLEPDSFAAWRYWVIVQGRDVFDRAVQDPDSLAGLAHLGAGCDYTYESVGFAATTVWFERHPPGTGGFAELDFTEQPGGIRLYGKDIDAALPRLTAARK